MEPTKVNPIQNKSDQELRQLAMDIVNNKVFTDRHIKASCQEEWGRRVPSVFMPLFMCQLPEKVGLIYEYLNEAGPLSVNDYPTFMSMRLLNEEDTNKLMDLIGEAKEQMEAAKKREQDFVNGV